MAFDIVLGIAWVALSFLMIGLAIYRVHNLVNYVIYVNPPAVMHID